MMDYKGKNSFVPYNERIQILKHVKYVDEVVPQTSMNKLLAWDQYQFQVMFVGDDWYNTCLLYTSPSPRDVEEPRMPSSA